MLKGLATQPGTVAAEYIEGKRKKYFNPFTFFLILMAAFVFSNSFFQEKQTYPSAEEVFSRMPPGKEKMVSMERYERGIKVRVFFSKHGNNIAMVAVPFFALLFWAVYRNKGLNYAEHLTAALLFISFANLVFTLVVFPLTRLTGSQAFTSLGLCFQVIYFTWAYVTLLKENAFSAKLKVFFVSLCAITLWTFLSMLFFAVYIYQSMDFPEFFARMISGGR